jgi:cell division protein FtsB
VGWIAACVLVVLLLPLIGMLYMDVLQTKKEAQTQIEKMEKLRREVEQKERENNK